MDGAEEAVTLPVLGVRRDDGVGGDDGEPEPARGGEDGVALLAGAELGVEVAGAALAEDALEEGGIAGEEDEAIAVVREAGGQVVGWSGGRVLPDVTDRLTARPPDRPMNPRNRPAERRPPALIDGERDGLLILGDQVRAEDGPHPRRLAGPLELDRPVDPVGVGARQRREPPLGGGGGEHVGARDADAEGEVGVDVEVGHGARRAWVRCLFGQSSIYRQGGGRQAACGMP